MTKKPFLWSLTVGDRPDITHAFISNYNFILAMQINVCSVYIHDGTARCTFCHKEPIIIRVSNLELLSLLLWSHKV